MEYATLHLDTYKVVKLLQEKGYTEQEAEGFLKAMQEITLIGVATRQDVQDVRNELQELKTELSDNMKNVATQLEAKISKGLSDNLRFQLIQTLTLVGVMIALFQYFSVTP